MVTHHSAPAPMVITQTNATRYEWEKRFQPSFSPAPRNALMASATTPTPAALTNNACPTSAKRMLSPPKAVSSLLPFAISVRVLCGSLEARARIRRHVVHAAAPAALQRAQIHDDRPAIFGFDLGRVARHVADAVADAVEELADRHLAQVFLRHVGWRDPGALRQ